MLLAMCFDTSMLVSMLLFLMVVGLAFAGLIALVVMGIVNLAGARRKRLDTLSLSDAGGR